jgi:2-polyprenyl-3-methyl-5-hydroxy-6-metoxy-1,4-benzoquinol methylase
VRGLRAERAEVALSGTRFATRFQLSRSDTRERRFNHDVTVAYLDRVEASGKPDFDRAAAGQRARAFFDELWAESDPWSLDDSDLDQRRYARQLELLGDRRYGRALEIGCASGSFTRGLAAHCGEVLAIDISEHAVERARGADSGNHDVEYRVANVMEFDLEREGTWDLVVFTETAYYLGWLYPMFDLAWLAHNLHDATSPGGRLLLVNTIGPDASGIMSPWLIHSYRDLFGHVGYALEREETMRGVKETVEFEILISLFCKEL